ncbi:MAG: serine hydrolase domain-containing protein [bacterium]
MHRIKSKTLWLIAFSALWLFSCGEDQATNPPAYSYKIPEQTNDGWQTASLADVGLDAKTVASAIDRINYNLYKNVHGILIVKDSKLVFEEYFSGNDFDGKFTEFDRTTLHYLASDTKSFTSALVGLAIDHGFIQSVDTTVFSFFPQYADLHNDEKDKITLAHFLSMSAGLQYDEWSYPYTDSRNDHVRMNRSSDPIRFVLGLPVEAAPGTKFVYNSGLSITLGGIIEKASSMRIDEFVETYLFGPLGISEYYWWKYPNGTFQTGGGLYMLPRDMAKFGLLYLNGGVWNGDQLISSEWVEKSTTAHISIDTNWSYGYQWWLRTYQANSHAYASFSARGWGGQYIFVFPDMEMVVVFTGGNYSTPEPVDEILTRFILPAVL